MLGFLFSLIPLVGNTLVYFWLYSLGILRTAEGMTFFHIGFYLSYLPYLIFILIRLAKNRYQYYVYPYSKKHTMVAVLILFLLPVANFFLLPIIERSYQHKLEQLNDWEELDDSVGTGHVLTASSPSTDYIKIGRLQKAQTWSRRDMEGQKLTNTILTLAYTPLMLILLIFIELKKNKDFLYQIPPLAILFLIPIVIFVPTYLVYLSNRIIFYGNSPEIRSVLDICRYLTLGTIICIFFLAPIILPIVETYVYFKVKSLTNAGYYQD